LPTPHRLTHSRRTAHTTLDVDDLAFTYAGKTEPALKGLSFSVQRGEIFGFLGPSGAGKSTTQKILMGLLHGYAGSVTVFGKQLRAWGADYYERVGVSFELPNHYQKLTALENLAFFRSLYKGETEDPMHLLERVGLAEDAHRRVSQFSKGMQQRLTLVRALINKPELIFFDEPTSGLDPTNARTVKRMIRDLQAQGRTIFLTTHDMHDADELCDRVAFIARGEIALIDAPRTLKLQRAERKVVVTRRVASGLEERNFPLDGLGDNPDFLHTLRSGTVETLHTVEATLEDIFIEVTGERLR